MLGGIVPHFEAEVKEKEAELELPHVLFFWIFFRDFPDFSEKGLPLSPHEEADVGGFAGSADWPGICLKRPAPLTYPGQATLLSRLGVAPGGTSECLSASQRALRVALG